MAFAVVLSLMLLAGPVPASAEKSTEDKFQPLASCMSEKKSSSWLFLMDTSKSLRAPGVDPDDGRVDALGDLLKDLNRKFSDSEIYVEILEFGSSVRRAHGLEGDYWQSLDDRSEGMFLGVVERLRTQDADRHTDYLRALRPAYNPARKAVAGDLGVIELFEKQDNDTCQVLVWFSDGELSLEEGYESRGLPLTFTAGDIADYDLEPGDKKLEELSEKERPLRVKKVLGQNEVALLEELCRPRGPVDVLRGKGVAGLGTGEATFIVTVGLGESGRFGVLQAIAEGDTEEKLTTHHGALEGSNTCGSEPGLGIYLNTKTVKDLPKVFADVSAGRGTKLCGREDECSERVEFQISPAMTYFSGLLDAGPGVNVTLEGPQGSDPYPLGRSQPPYKTPDGKLDVDAPEGKNIRVHVESPTAGEWAIVFDQKHPDNWVQLIAAGTLAPHLKDQFAEDGKPLSLTFDFKKQDAGQDALTKDELEDENLELDLQVQVRPEGSTNGWIQLTEDEEQRGEKLGTRTFRGDEDLAGHDPLECEVWRDLNKKTRDELECLVPPASALVVVEDGFQMIPAQTWSVLSPPEVRAKSDDSKARLQIRPRWLAGDDEPNSVDPIIREFDGSATVLHLAQIEPPLQEGTYRLELFQGSKTTPTQTARLVLASANYPKLTSNQNSELLGYDHASLQSSVLSAVNTENPIVEGAITRSENPEPLHEECETFVPQWSDATAKLGQFEEFRSDTRTAIHAIPIGDYKPECLDQGGAHHLIGPKERPNEARDPFQKFICKYCGFGQMEVTSHARAKSKKKKSPGKANRIAPTFNPSKLPPVTDVTDPEITADLALDSLSHHLSGNASQLRAIAAQIDPSPITINNLMRDFISLGHIDVTFDDEEHRPLQWQITPTTFAGTTSGTFVLTGFRSTSLVQRLEFLVEEFSGTLNKYRGPNENSPTVLEVENVEPETLQLIIQDLPGRPGRPTQLIPDASLRLVNALPNLSDLMESLPAALVLSTPQTEEWKPAITRFESAQDINRVGFFRQRGYGTRYVIRQERDIENNTMSVTDHRFLKHAAALKSGMPLVGYDASERWLYVPPGAELPGLFGRAAVLASGHLPVFDNGALIYQDVPPALAGILLRKLNN